jgi:hypothetical protein
MTRAIKRKSENTDSVNGDSSNAIGNDDRVRARIAEQAYYLYEKRGCIPGHEAEDWLEAERLVRAELGVQTKKPPKVTARRRAQRATV